MGCIEVSKNRLLRASSATLEQSLTQAHSQRPQVQPSSRRPSPREPACRHHKASETLYFLSISKPPKPNVHTVQLKLLTDIRFPQERP